MSILIKSGKRGRDLYEKTAIPKVEISRVIWANIRKAQYLNCLSDEQLAKALEVSTRTLHNYDINPDVMTLATVQIFTKNMSMPFEQLIII